MPTERRRFQVTETEEVARALDEAAKRWPNEPRSRLIVRAIMTGGEALAQRSITEDRLAALRRIKGSYTDVFDHGYLDELRSDWTS